MSWRQRARAAMAATLPRRYFLVQGPRSSRSVCLTFDDGPHPEHTPRLLDVLADQGVPATFFVIGQRAEEHPDIIRRMVAEGHCVGHHSYSHSDPARTPAKCLADEIRRTLDILHSILGNRPDLFRPPHGKLTVGKLARVWLERQTVALWSLDPKDYQRRHPDELIAWFRDHPPAAGDIILMHDNHSYAAATLPDLVRDVRARGLGFVDLADWIR